MSIKHGSLASIGATALRLVSSFTDAVNIKWVYVKASSSNAGIVYIGSSSAVTAGGTPATNWYPLSANDVFYFETNTPSELFAIASTTGQEVYFWINY